MKRRVGASRRQRLERRAAQRAAFVAKPARAWPRCTVCGRAALKYHGDDRDGRAKLTCAKMHDYFGEPPETIDTHLRGPSA